MLHALHRHGAMTVNVAKLFVFRKGGRVEETGKWTYGGRYLAVFDKLSYLLQQTPNQTNRVR